jgi:hypothetical protein
VHKRIISAVKRVEFVSDRMSYIILSGRWCIRESYQQLRELSLLVIGCHT